MRKFVAGQRWLSEAEPELGLGLVLSVAAHQVTVVFRASGTTRVYSIEQAPLKRVQFREGDSIQAGDGPFVKVTEVLEENGLAIYIAGSQRIPEPLIADHVNLNTPKERLMAGRVDESRAFDLRRRALEHRYRTRLSPVRGFTGARIGLIPHQLHIAAEACRRERVRILLADEVGLGKTIESCLILHRLLITGRVQRVLILVPESLVHQWFVELLRRFNLWFSIFDEERCASIEQHDPAANPFLDNQWVIASIDLLSGRPERLQQALEASWDLLIIDEAHHLHWTPEQSSPAYDLAQALAAKTPHTLLVTATPEQLGEAGHFARLRLLDPERYHDLPAYLRQHEHYEQVARVAANIADGKALEEAEAALVAQALNKTPAEVAQMLAVSAAPAARQTVLDTLIDQHGPGRVMFRNTRSAMRGFPRRIPDLIPLETEDPDAMIEEFQSDLDPQIEKPPYEFEDDPRLRWLADFLRENPGQKVLLLCRYLEKAEAIESALRDLIKVKAALFHEKLPLVQRDRQAAWFAEEEGARILICSEIGSEGRNFQFVQHLVLFDLPWNPELLEQRIGRLDRIGQKGDIQVHVPYAKGTPQEVLARWYHEGLNAFAENFSGVSQVHAEFQAELRACAAEPESVRALKTLLPRVRAFRSALAERLEAGRDRLLEIHSFRAESATRLVNEIAAVDADVSLDRFVVDSFDHYGLHLEELGQRTLNLGGGDLFKEKLPGLPAEGLTATADRARALTREDIAFLSWEHPIVTSLMDMLLGSEAGNSSFVLWPNAPVGGVLVEAIYLLDPAAPAGLELDRWLPSTPIRILLNHKRQELTVELGPDKLEGQLKNGTAAMLASQMQELESLVPGMIRVTEIIAGKRSKPMIETALAHARGTLSAEIARLEHLRAAGGAVTQTELDALRGKLAGIEEKLQSPPIRLDALRLILASAAPNAGAKP